ncbi:methyltransferase domain-containing protein [bacterium]|nr:methyltransferase domain-containing protein [bacterium]
MPIATPDIEFLRDLIARQSGNVLRSGQGDLIEVRLRPLAAEAGLENVEQLVAELRRTKSPRLADQVAQAVTVNETSFFRDIHPFNALQSKIIPDVTKENAARRELKIWCAAASSGQEPYTIAMVIREHFPTLSNWNVRILATDISEKMLARCSSGQYTQLEVNRGLPARNLLRYFDRSGSVWTVKPELRNLIDFQRLNLTTSWPITSQFDVIFIRNVLIYFDQQTKADILRRALRQMRPNGYLFIGSAETVIGLNLPLQREEIDGTVCYRHLRG